jgi:hypothetical protein
MPTTAVRTVAKQTLVAAIAAGLPDTQVTYGWPGGDIHADCVYVQGPHQAVVAYPLMMAGRKIRDDVFVLTIYIFGYGAGMTLLEIEQHVEELYAAVEDALAAADLGFDGQISTELGPSVLGPNSSLVKEGAQALMTAEVTVHTRLD